MRQTLHGGPVHGKSSHAEAFSPTDVLDSGRETENDWQDLSRMTRSPELHLKAAFLLGTRFE